MTTIEELSIFCRSVEDGQPVQHFLEIVLLKTTNAKTIYSALIKFMKDKNIYISKLVGMRFDGAATFSGKHNGMQSLLKNNSPHAVFIHCHCHLLQLGYVQAANVTSGKTCIRDTHHPLEIFPLLSQVSQESKEVQRVLNLPELKIVKAADTRWLAHEHCQSQLQCNCECSKQHL